jgi:transglutaminase-like putative cysteine protease
MSRLGLHALPAAAAGVALALAATSLTAVLGGSRWWGFVVLSTATVVLTGVLLRWVRAPSLGVVAGQLAALLGLVTAMFTSSGVLGVLPGPAAAAQLRGLLEGAGQQIRVGLPPVPESTELICLVVLVLGVLAIVVDTLTVSATAPACSGLVLLAVVTVPAVASNQLLPWWTFVLGATGFALLLAVDSLCRQLAWGAPVGTGRHLGAAPAAVAVTGGAVLVALLVGATVTVVGTGRVGGPHTGAPARGIGLSPFTALRGQLDSGEVVSLFRITGLQQQTYLRALTLSRFTPKVGWQQEPPEPVVPAGSERSERLPLPAGVSTPTPGLTIQARIEPINYVDNWLPTFGYPLALDGVGPEWNYDPDALTIFSNRRQRAGAYTEFGLLPQPDLQQLRAAGPAGSPSFHHADPRLLDTGGVDPRVAQLAARVTAGSRTAFDSVVTLNQWFTQPGNFRYDVTTAPGNGADALVDFLFTGRRGYCEQFASAMAIMLRTLQVPARVAIGFAPGTAAGNTRLITTKDAHAWVEAWFPGTGWLPFDPTPRADLRSVTPGYQAAQGNHDQPGSKPVPAVVPPASSLAAPPAAPPAVPVELPEEAPASSAATRIGLTVAGLLVLAALVVFTPLAVREVRRWWRWQRVRAGGMRAIAAAWEEVLAESADRGVVAGVGETVRASAERLMREHRLDEAGQRGLRALVDAAERSWYASTPRPGTSVRHSLSQRAGGEVETALRAVCESLQRCAPLSRADRLRPRSVLSRQPVRR